MSDSWTMYINGEFVEAESGNAEPIINPANDETIASVPYGGAFEARAAMDAAAEAFDTWKQANAWDRAATLYAAAGLIRDRVDDIARIMSLEVGKPLAESRGEILASANYYEWFADEAKRIYGQWVPPAKEGVRRWVMRQPIGVCAAISPWNFPFLLPSRKIAAATAAGCTIVCRPSLTAPLAAMELFRCLHDAGFPPGVVNHVLGPGDELATAFMQHPACRKISFTGSTEVGRDLMRKAADNVQRVSLELGGSAPVLIFEDVDVPTVAEKTVQAKFRNNGQVCIASTRFYAHESIYEGYLEHVIERTEALQQGDPMQEGVDIGPLCNRQAREKMEKFVADATGKGARILKGGKRPEGDQFEKGCWFEPTVLVDVPGTARLTCDEVFGPLMPIFPFSDTEQAIQEANDTIYGLAGYIFTNDLARAIEVSEALEFGIIGLNDMVPATAECPFGGMKQSGMGREGGSMGIDDYLEVKYISVGIE